MARRQLPVMNVKNRFSSWVGVLLLGGSACSHATIYTLDVPTALGEYSSSDAQVQNVYSVGSAVSYALRTYFVFDLSSLPQGTINLANSRFTIYMPGGGYPYPAYNLNASETFAIGSVSTPISTLVAGGGTYADLGAGTLFGSRSVSFADENTLVQVGLNSSFASAVATLLGTGQIALGGYLQGVEVPVPPYDPSYRVAFWGGNGSPSSPGYTTLTLDITPVPEPGAFLAMVPVLGAIAGHQVWRRRRKTA
jgi:hypothetical protein